MSRGLFGAGAFALLTALNLTVPFGIHWRRMTVLTYLLQLISSELVSAQLLLHGIATVVLVSFGGLGQWPGQLGLAFEAAAVVLFVRAERKAAESAEAAVRALDTTVTRFDGPGFFSRLVPLALVGGSDWERIADLPYGETRIRNTLDVYRPRSKPTGAPVLVYIHGGAWLTGSKRQQGRPMIEHFVRHGWVCVSINYRLSPRTKWPTHLIDAKRALAWVHEHIAEYGGNPNRIVVSGGSAGAQMAALVSLTPGRPELQPGFEQASTSVRGCIACYGPYDVGNLLIRQRQRLLVPTLTKIVFGILPWEPGASFEQIDVTNRVHPDAPAFLLVHGDHDVVVPQAQSSEFAVTLKAVSKQPVDYLPLPGAMHAFDVFQSRRTQLMLHAALAFAERAIFEKPAVHAPPVDVSVGNPEPVAAET